MNSPPKCAHSKGGQCDFMKWDSGDAIACDGHDYECVGYFWEEDESQADHGAGRGSQKAEGSREG